MSVTDGERRVNMNGSPTAHTPTPRAAADKLVEIANSAEAVKDGRIQST
jgi:hypothetical protein